MTALGRARWTDEVAASLSTLARARAIAAGIPGAGVAEAVYDLPFSEVWRRLTEFERSVPNADRLVGRLRVDHREALGDGVERIRLTAWTPLGLRQRFDVRLEPGFCLMGGRAYTVVMAAAPEPGDPARTRYVQVEAVPAHLGRLLAPLLRATVRGDVRGFARYLRSS